MKSVVKVSAAIALVASTVSAQIDRFPPCAYDCLSQLNAIAGCGNTDYPCFCASNAFLAGFNPCISYACQPQDYQAVSDAAEGLCLGAGHTVTVTVVAPTATPSPPPELARFPSCAIYCVSQLNAISPCGDTDYGCLCASREFRFGFGACISLFCEPKDYGATSNAAEELCADNGVTVTVTATFTPPPQPTVAPSSTAPARTTEPSETEPSKTEPAETTGAEETEPAETTGAEETEPAETTGAEETEPAETTGPEETEPAETSGPEETEGPAETSGPEETDGPVETTMATVTSTEPDATTTAPPSGNGTTSGSGSTPTTNAGARHTAFAGLFGAALVVGAALL
ncbi:hypothetical protein TWF730_001617 [Orbilia blumenaviensis]|uniref:CFEM domain-containing protein n=1 Tax=Orbilia blumenaviensis TaxID=1796055 RepID=A0AAV9UPD9_9PEZI